jgi:Protein of unknown function (DUF2459)
MPRLFPGPWTSRTSIRLGRALRLAVLLTLPLCGCEPGLPACEPASAAPNDVVFVVEHGWHTDLAIPAEALRGNMAIFRDIFPGLQVLVVGFGKRTFMIAPVTTSGDLLVGPFPGQGAIMVVGLKGPPAQAYEDGMQTAVRLPPGGAERLSDFIWDTLQTHDGHPLRIRDGLFPGSVFYATRIGYAGTYTCNTWTADALHAAGVPVDTHGVIFAGQTMSRLARVSRASCAINGVP